MAFTRCKICTDRSDNNYSITDDVLGKSLPDIIEHISGIQITTLNVARVHICQTCAVALIQAESVVEKLRRSLSNVTKKKLNQGKPPPSASQKKESDGAESESINDIAPGYQQTEKSNLSAFESSSSQCTINNDDGSEKDEPPVEKKAIEVNPPKKSAAKRKTPTASAKRDLSTSLNDAAPVVELNSDEPDSKTNSTEFKTPKKATPRKRAPTAAAKRKLDISQNGGASSIETNDLNKTDENQSKAGEYNANTPETKTPKKAVAKRKTPTTAAQRKKVIPGPIELQNSELEETKNSSLADGKERTLESEISFTNQPIERNEVEVKNLKKVTPKKVTPKTKKDTAAKKTPLKRQKINVDSVSLKESNQLEILSKASNDVTRNEEEIEESVEHITIQSTNIKAVTPKETANSKAKKSTPLTAAKRRNSVIGNSHSAIKSGERSNDSDSDSEVEANRRSEVTPKPLKSILKRNTPAKFEIKFETKMNSGKKEAMEKNTDELVASLMNGGPLIQKTKKSSQNNSSKIATKPIVDDVDDQEPSLIDIGSLFQQFERPNLLESYNKDSDSDSKIKNLSWNVEPQEDHTTTKDTPYKSGEESTVQKTSAKKNIIKPLATKKKTPNKVVVREDSTANQKISIEDPEESSLIDMGHLFGQPQDSPKKAVKRKRPTEESVTYIDVDSELNETQESQVNYTIEGEENSQDDTGDYSSGTKKSKKKKIERNFLCPQCPETSFRDHAALQNHMSNTHDQLSLICSQPGCSKTFASHGHLTNHLTTRHPAVKQHTCVICGKRFALIAELRTHMDKRHMGEDVLTCAHCAATFRSQKKYEAHVFSEKCKNAVHPCQYCERQFVVPSKLHHHVAKKHPGVGDKGDDILD